MALPNEVKVIALNDVMSALTGAEMLEDGNAKKQSGNWWSVDAIPQLVMPI